MSGFNGIKSCYSGLIGIGNFFQHLLLLAFRLYWGLGFFMAGSQKFVNVAQTAEFFGNIGIPAPEFFVYLVAIVETLGGLLLIVGFASRLSAISLAIVMIIALMTAHYEGASMILADPAKFLGEAPVTFLMATLVVFCFGPGWVSLDYLIEAFCCKKEKS